MKTEKEYRKEIKVGSKWVNPAGTNEVVTIVHINPERMVLEYDDDVIILVDIENFTDRFTPYIEPKPLLKVYKWKDANGNLKETLSPYGRNIDWVREPRLDYEAE